MEWYFKHVVRYLPNPHGDLAKLMPTKTKVVLPLFFVTAIYIYGIRIMDISRFVSAGKLFISDRNPPVFVDMVASNAARKC